MRVSTSNLAVLVANLPLVSLIPVVHLDLQISPRIFEKNEMTLMLLSEVMGVSPAYGYIESALVKCSNDGGPGPRHNMKGDPGSSIFSMLVV
jgi:hypothetical protein